MKPIADDQVAMKPEVEKPKDDPFWLPLLFFIGIIGFGGFFGFLFGDMYGRHNGEDWQRELDLKYAPVQVQLPHDMPAGMAAAQAAALTGELMGCLGDPSGWTCHPYWWGFEDYSRTSPVVVCFDGACARVSR